MRQFLSSVGFIRANCGAMLDFNYPREQGWTLPTLMPVPVILRDYVALGLPEGKPLWEFIRDRLGLVKTIASWRCWDESCTQGAASTTIQGSVARQD